MLIFLARPTKMIRRIHILLTLLVLMSAPASLPATVAVRTEKLVEQADWIVAGRVVNLEAPDADKPWRYVFTLHIECVLEGDAMRGKVAAARGPAIVKFRWEKDFEGPQHDVNLRSDELLIVYLKRNTDGESAHAVDLVDPWFGIERVSDVGTRELRDAGVDVAPLADSSNVALLAMVSVFLVVAVGMAVVLTVRRSNSVAVCRRVRRRHNAPQRQEPVRSTKD
ncbi:MAG: hypothetical protein RIC55_31830 [Pirellulaceae bacterium]